MKNTLNEKAIIGTTLILLMTLAILMTNSPVNAEQAAQQQTTGPLPSGVTPNATVPTKAFLSFRPNPVGAGQTILVNLWTTPAPGANRLHKDYTITITNPNGTARIIKMDSYVADGTAWFEYLLDQVGTWKLKFDFQGTYYPAGQYNNGIIVTSGGSAYDSAYYQPSSTPEQTLTVQQDIVASWPPSAIPTDYWIRPVSPDNREWWIIAGNYPWNGMGLSYFDPEVAKWQELYPNTNPYWSAQERFTPWVQAPESAHIVWREQGVDAGVVGGDVGTEVIAPGGIQGLPQAGNPNIIYNGKAYQTYTKVMPQTVNGTIQSMPTTVWRCYDIRTGKVFWEQTGVTAPTVLEYEIRAAAVPGAEFAGGMTVNLLALSSNRLLKYNPLTGAAIANISIPVTGTYYMNGYVLAVQDLGSAAGANRYRLINWTTAGTDTNFTTRIVSNTTYARSSLPTLIDWGAGLGATVSGVTVAGAYEGTTLQGINLLTGASMWNVTVPETQYSGSCNIADHGKVATLTQQGYYLAYDIATGKQAWKGELMDYPWDQSGFGAYSVQSAYGLLYHEGYSGVYAFNWDDGKIAWKYEAPSAYPYEAPYTGKNGTGVYPFDSGAIVADGKVYVGNEEHSSTQPLTRGWSFHCINATTGKGIWKVAIAGIPGPVADGYLTMSSIYDGYQYIFGKGQSTTTISAPQTAITQGQSVVLTGTVLDQSPAQPGTPCISPESMGDWMTHLYMQTPVPANITGVPVSLDTVDPNGNSQHITTVTSDMSGVFSYMWTPDVTGKYVVTATFLGDASYGSSWAETAVGVTTPSATSTPAPTQQAAALPPFELYFAATAVAIIIAIAVATILLLRKKQ